jgi:predicted phage terminase large subunit-like protein
MSLTGTTRAPLVGSLAEARAAEVLGDWRLTPATLMSKLDPGWIPAKWLQYLAFKIAQCVARGNCGLLISAPPRHGKSLLSTIATPLWVLENFPHKNVVLSTYGEELSTDFSRQIRDLIVNNQDLLSVRLRADTQRVTNFLTTKGGGLKAVGLRGAITGRGADVFVLDDYIKEPKEAMSATYLEDLWTWYLTVSRTRLEPGAVVIILATRWVPNDIHGRIMKKQAETGRRFFEYVELPAISHDNEVDPIGRGPHEPLFAERYSLQALEDLKTDLGSRWFSAMFQQRPLDDENAVVNTGWFKKLPREDFNTRVAASIKLGHKLQYVRSWDMASTKTAGDFTSGPRCLYNKDTEEFYIESMVRGQFSAARAEAEFELATAGDYRLAPNIMIGMEQEPGSSGAYSIRHFEGIARKVVPGARVHEQRAVTSKLLRAQPLLAAAEAGKVYVVDVDERYLMTPNQRTWLHNFYEELETFPEGAHDDQVDSTSNAYLLATGKKPMAGSFGRSAAAKAAIGQSKVEVMGEKRRSVTTFGRNTSTIKPNRSNTYRM